MQNKKNYNKSKSEILRLLWDIGNRKLRMEKRNGSDRERDGETEDES